MRSGDGVHITDSRLKPAAAAKNNQIQGNYIGVGADGAAPLANGGNEGLDGLVMQTARRLSGG